MFVPRLFIAQIIGLVETGGGDFARGRPFIGGQGRGGCCTQHPTAQEIGGDLT